MTKTHINLIHDRSDRKDSDDGKKKGDIRRFLVMFLVESIAWVFAKGLTLNDVANLKNINI